MPIWLQIVLGLCAPLIAAFGAGIGYQQWKLSKYKLKHDLFERRWAVYAAAHDAAARALTGSEQDRKDAFLSFVRQIKNAEFLFPAEVRAHLQELGEHLDQYAQAEKQHASSRDEEREQAQDEVLTLANWIRQQPDRLVEIFRPYLELTF